MKSRTSPSRAAAHRRRRRIAPLVLCACASPALAVAQSAAADAPDDTIVVTGSVTQRRLDEAPYAISAVGRDELRAAGPMINLSEALGRVPGLVVNNRSNFAQDLQIGSRGFGARATFGVRGIRLYADGIPASGPDGQGQVSHMDLAGAQRIEVLRGPFSSLYGNSSGGVIAIFTAPVRRAEWEVGFDVGSFGLRQGRVSLATPLGGGIDLRASVSAAEIDGFRPQSAADKRQGNLRLGYTGERDSLTVVINALDQPALDPLGLTQAQFALGPQETASVATQFQTRKTQQQVQWGLNWRHRFDEGALRESSVSVYGGTREVAQWLAIAPATQAPARHGGGVVDFARGYEGTEARLRWSLGTVDLTAGASSDRQRDDRRGYENYTGTVTNPVLGVLGNLRRDEANFARTNDVFAQADWAVTPRLSASAGVRTGRVSMSSQDAYIRGVNGDDSGAVDYRYTNPVLGLRWQLVPGVQLFGSVARGYESPTLGELAYRADGTGGFNTALQGQSSRQAELGVRLRQEAWRADLTAFAVRTRDEIGVATNAGGRSAFQNVGRTSRSGLELSGDWTITSSLRAQAAATVLRATYQDSFLTCATIPCTTPNATVAAGNRIAGAPKATGWTELSWHGGTWGTWGLEYRGSGSYFASDRNTASSAVAGYGIASLRWSRSLNLGPGTTRWEWLVRVDNLADRHYAGSVIVNDANERYFEPGSPRSVLIALRLNGGL